MGKGSKYGQLQRTLNKHAGQIDRAIARNKDKPQSKPKSLKQQIEDYVPLNERTFEVRFPKFSDYEIALEEAGIDIPRCIRELADYCGMNTKPREAYEWIKTMYADKVMPTQAKEAIKTKLGW